MKQNKAEINDILLINDDLCDQLMITYEIGGNIFTIYISGTLFTFDNESRLSLPICAMHFL